MPSRSSTRSPRRSRAGSAAGSSCSSARSSTTTSTTTEDLFLEAEPLQQLARDDQLTVNKHEGFWAAMDTYKDYQSLDALWSSGEAPWKLWDDPRGW